jgi:ActR/RegA family two-component response regulator
MESSASRWAGRSPDQLTEALELVQAALAEDPAAGLEAVARLRPLLDTWEDLQVEQARSGGWNWAEIAKRLGRHRQAVHREYARRNRDEPAAHRDTA